VFSKIIGNGLIQVGAGPPTLTIARIEWLLKDPIFYLRFHLSDGSVAGSSSSPQIQIIDEFGHGNTYFPNDFSGDTWEYTITPGSFDPTFGIKVLSGLYSVTTPTGIYTAGGGIMDLNPNPALEF
jgi:hypothetical protein